MTLTSTDGIKTDRDIVQPMITIIKTVHPDLPVIVERPNVPRPNEPYISVRVLTPVGKLGAGATDMTFVQSGGQQIRSGQRLFTFSIKAYLVINESNESVMDNFHDPQDILSELLDSFEDPSFDQNFLDVGLAVFGTEQILDVTELINSGYESRAQLDLFMGIASNRAVDLGEIEDVEFTGTYDGQAEDAILVEGT